VSGEGGIGKTAFCEAFLRAATSRHAMRASWAQCQEYSGPSEPYYPLLDAIAGLARSAGDDTVISVLQRHAPSWLPHLSGFADHDWQTVPGAARVGSAARMLREIVSALEALAETTTLVIWLEDIHWADPATIDVLASLGQRRDPARLLVLATTRPPESVPSASALRRAHGLLIAHGRATEIRMQPLELSDVTRYLDLRFGCDRATSAASVLHRSTDGNPLFLVTAVDHLVRKRLICEGSDGWVMTASPQALEAAIPASLASAVLREMEELADEERQAIEAASVIGIQFSLWLAASAAESDELAIEPILEMLARRQSVIVRDGVVELANGTFSPLYRFRHALYQEIVLNRTGTALRARAHQRVGIAIEQAFAGREREVAADLACHFHGAGDHSRSARYLRLAAENARLRYAPREAAALLHGAVAHCTHLGGDDRAALELPLMLELGQAHLAAGEVDIGVQTLSRLERRTSDNPRNTVRLRALLALAEAHVGSSRELALQYASQTAEHAAASTDTSLGAIALIRAGVIQLYFDGWSDGVADRSIEAFRTLPKGVDDDRRSLAVRLLLLKQVRSGYGAVWRGGRKLLAQALASGDVADCMYCYYVLGLAAIHLGRWDDALEIVREGLVLAEKTGSARPGAALRQLLAWMALECQQWEEARRLSLADRQLIETGGWHSSLQMSLLFGGRAALGLGLLHEASADLERLRNWYARERLLLDWFWQPQLHGYLAQLALRQRDVARATAEAAAGVQAATSTPERTLRSRARITSARVALERQAFADAERELRHARQEIRGIEAPLAGWRLEATAASLFEQTERPDSARRARQRYERMRRRLERSTRVPSLESWDSDGPEPDDRA
jgi:hypothetical protein